MIWSDCARRDACRCAALGGSLHSAVRGAWRFAALGGSRRSAVRGARRFAHDELPAGAPMGHPPFPVVWRAA
jgi:hypothetical protein